MLLFKSLGEPIGMLRAPDILFVAVSLAVSVALLVWLGKPIWETESWQSFLFLAIPLIHTIGVTSWWTSRRALRLLGFKFYYRFFGPTCTVRILGRFQVNPSLSDADLLKDVYSLTKQWDHKAKVELSNNNRSVIRAGAQTLTTTVATMPLHQEYEQDQLGAENEDAIEKLISLDLGGYEGAIASLDNALRKRALPLLLRFNSEMKKQGTFANLSLEAHIAGTNPFLIFYLRGVPTSDLKGFNLKLTAEKNGLPEMLEVTSNSITVAARTPDALVESARNYLASPALAYRS